MAQFMFRQYKNLIMLFNDAVSAVQDIIAELFGETARYLTLNVKSLKHSGNYVYHLF
jgi:hypothetical protein